MPLSYGFLQKWSMEKSSWASHEITGKLGTFILPFVFPEQGNVEYCETPKICKLSQEKNGRDTHICSHVPSSLRQQSVNWPMSSLVGKWPSWNCLLTIQRWAFQIISTNHIVQFRNHWQHPMNQSVMWQNSCVKLKESLISRSCLVFIYSFIYQLL